MKGVDFSKDILEFEMFFNIKKGMKDFEIIIKVEVNAQIKYMGVLLGNYYSYVLYVHLTTN
jgi:hypothetical protein